MSVNFTNGEKVNPGQILGKQDDSITPSHGVIVQSNKYYSVLKGEAHFTKITADPLNPTITHILTVTRPSSSPQAGIQLGDTVLARVMKIKQDTVFVNIVVVNDHPISIELEGVIKRRDIREKEIDKIDMEECFIPGDIVKAEVASYGDSRRIQLKTHDNDFGVVYARSQETGGLMFPISPNEMICPVTKVKEMRKVAIPDIGDFEEEEA